MRTALYESEKGHAARFSEYFGWEVAEHFGDPRAEYDAVRRDAGVLDVCYAGKLRVIDRDRVRYLHNMLSNDIKNLAAGKGCYATLLTHQGRIESDLFVYSFPEELRIECSPAGSSRLTESLNKYIIGDRVTVEDWTGRWGILSLQGPRSRLESEKLLDTSLENLGPLDHRTLECPSGDRAVVRRDRTGCDGFDIWAPVEDMEELWRRLVEEEKIVPVGHRALNWLRTEAGIPWYGVDMDDKTLPMEVGLLHALSMTKGCYRGQEIVARVLHRGHLDRSLGGVVLESDELPESGAEVRVESKRIGEITSAASSPRLSHPLALAILKNEFLNPGTAVDVMRGEARVSGRVVALPVK